MAIAMFAAIDKAQMMPSTGSMRYRSSSHAMNAVRATKISHMVYTPGRLVTPPRNQIAFDAAQLKASANPTQRRSSSRHVAHSANSARLP